MSRGFRGGSRGRVHSRGGSGAFRGRRGRGRGAGVNGGTSAASLPTEADGVKDAERSEDAAARDAIDEKLGFARFQSGPSKIAWLVNMHATTLIDDVNQVERSAVDYYFIEEDGGLFKATLVYEPYFYLAVKKGMEGQVEEWLMRKFEGIIVKLERKRKDDLKMPNHLMGYQRTFIRLNFKHMNDFFAVRRELLPIATKNQATFDAVDTYAEVVDGMDVDGAADDEHGYVPKASRTTGGGAQASDHIIDIREYDVPYYQRVAIDKGIRVGLWYTVAAEHGDIRIDLIKERVERAEPVVMAYDIETTKAPLKFPDQAHDQVMMISYMIDGQGFLITNREIVSDDIDDFEYTPKPEYEGPFVVFNEPDEPSTLNRFFEHIRDAKPTVIATYNGDSFDFPFLCARAAIHGIDMLTECGFAKDNENEFKSRSCIHMDCYRWVKRDSYLPQGSQGLKAVTVAKLGYDPIELDPELMTPYAIERPQELAQYSVSDAVATYYLYMKYVHPFIFSLCNIIPLNPDEVLRKGSGTLCETLLMVEAWSKDIIMPNRHVESQASFYEGHLLESETYVGGHVEALEAGVFRSDIATEFRMVPDAVQQLIDDLDAALHFSIVEEGKHQLEDVLNYDEVKAEITGMLEDLRDHPMRADKPLIYHLDVAAMYPNIMLSNRLQPDSVVSEAMCAACDYNRPGKTCDRRMHWAWRGEFFPAKLDEFKMVRNALEQEWFPPKYPGKPERRFVDLSPAEQTSLLHKRLGDYSRKVYKKTHDTKVVVKESIICQRENPFYINTVRDFRDRRYEYKGLHKTWKRNLDNAFGSGSSLTDIDTAKKMIVLYDSLQLAHKCILNSFYGYVMRKGARWHSMEMAGITCLTGATIIQMARQLVEQIGRPLELDTDGIWCMLPSSFPDAFNFSLKSGKSYAISYPCTMLNHLVHARFTNDQYHDLTDPVRGTYQVRSENSIFFELDGPYRAMILPSSKEEDKLLKKRYAVFNEDGTLAELKGFEVKRRGELQLIKIFQSQIFERFLLGQTLADCYAAVAIVANQWLDVLSTKAASLSDEELIELIAENRSMSKTLSEYAGQKSTSISTAKRLSEFLGEQMVKDKERAIPVAIFSAESSIKRHFLRRWLKDNSLLDLEMRSILDWEYYTERLGSVIQKLITIPAAMQKISNPVPRIRHPDWLLRRVNNLEDRFKQHKLTDLFSKRHRQLAAEAEDRGVTVADLQAEYAKSRPPKKTPTVVDIRPEEPQGPPPDPTLDYRGWLRAMKPEWRRKRLELNAAHAAGANVSSRGLAGMMRQQTVGFMSDSWDVVSLATVAGRPGDFKAWVLIRGKLQSLRLRIPRIFYLNFDSLPSADDWPQGCLVESISRTLPRGQANMHLFRITVPEDTYMSQEAAFSRLLNRPEIDGVYELQVPLSLRALVQIGNCCVPAAKASVNKGLNMGFDLAELKRAPATLSRRKYLDSGRGLKCIYMYHTASDRRHLIGLVFPDGRVKLLVVEGTRASNPAVPNLERYYVEDALTAHRQRLQIEAEENEGVPPQGIFDYPEGVQVDVSYHAAEDTAFRALQRELVGYGGQRHVPTILVVSSSHGQQYIEDKVGVAASQFPIVAIALSRADSPFGQLEWQRKGAQRFMHHYLRISGVLHERIDVANAADVPLAVLPTDSGPFLADIDFARRLSKADMLLWWSSDARPNIGGREHDANLPAEELDDPEVNRPGAFTNASLEIDVRDLAVDAVLQSALVYELEGAEGASIGFAEASHNLDEYAKGTAHAAVVLGDAVMPTQTFAIMKAMVRSWWTDAARGHSHARLMLEHFWRWISSTSSRLYDPAIQRFVHGLMRKTFSQLLSEFKRLGAAVIHASFTRLYLSTNKPTASAAYAYSNYIVSSVNSRELFKYLTLQITGYWEMLIWMDSANFGGIRCDDPLAEQLHYDGHGDARLPVDLYFNIEDFLPPALRPQFKAVLRRYCRGLYGCHLRSSDVGRTPLRVLPNATNTVGATPKEPQDANGKIETDDRKSYVAHVFTKFYLEGVEALREHERFASSDERVLWRFVTQPGTHLTPTNPILEFVKSTCAIFALAADLSVEVGILKRNVLGILGTREFAPEAAFKNPALSYRLPITCQHCTTSCVLDLTRDARLLSLDDPHARKHWCCAHCGHAYERSACEAALIEGVVKTVATYQMQDLRCSRCKQIKANNLAVHCECSGTFRTTDARGELLKKLHVATAVAEWYEFGALAETLKLVGPATQSL